MSDLFTKFRERLEQLVGPQAVSNIRNRARNDAMGATAKDAIDELTAAEAEAMNNCIGLLRELYGRASEVLDQDHLQRMNAHEDVVGELKNIPRDAEGQIQRMLDASRLRIQASFAKKNQLIRVLRAFQDEHDIHDVPEDKNKILFFAGLMFMLILETALNGTMLAKTSLYGLVGAWGEALFISFCNIFMGFGIGTGPFRYVKMKEDKQKTHLKILSYLSPSIVIVFNFIFAHYRYITDPTIIDNIKAVVESLLGQPFSIFLSMKTLSLFIAGLLFSGIAAWEGMTVYTPYLGYYDKFKKWDKSRMDCEGLRESAFAMASEIYMHAKDKVNELQDKVIKNVLIVDSAIKRSDIVVKNYASCSNDIVEGCNELFRAYRRTYEQVRGENIPLLPNNTPELPVEIRSVYYNVKEACDIYEYVNKKRTEFDTEKADIINELLEGENQAYKSITEYFEKYENEQGIFADENLHCPPPANIPAQEKKNDDVPTGE